MRVIEYQNRAHDPGQKRDNGREHKAKGRFMERKNVWKTYGESDLAKLEEIAAGYIEFISKNKTERECAADAIARAQAAGYVSLDDARARGERLQPGDKVWAHVMGKALMLVHIGRQPIEQGVNILGAHIDSPRLDLKQNPAYEAGGFAFLDTHYYGGIKKYQWVTLPLAIHGVVAKKDGSTVQVNVGEDAGDPVFCVTDLLIHLANKQMEKNASTVVEGEALDVLAGSRPLLTPEEAAELAGEEPPEKDAEKTELEKLAEKEPVKAYLLQLLAEKYGIAEEDFLSAELEVVPAGRAARPAASIVRMVIGYGQDDRVCAYTSLAAQLALGDDDPRPHRCLRAGGQGGDRQRGRLRHGLECSSRTPSLRSWPSPARAARCACAAPSPARACCPRTCPPDSTPPTRASSKRRTLPIWAAVSCSTSTPARGARADPTSPRPSTSRSCVASWTTRA